MQRHPTQKSTMPITVMDVTNGLKIFVQIETVNIVKIDQLLQISNKIYETNCSL